MAAFYFDSFTRPRRTRTFLLMALAMIVATIVASSTIGSKANAAITGQLVSTLVQHCFSVERDAAPPRIIASADLLAVRELSDELIAHLGGPFTSYDAWTVVQERSQHPVLLVAAVERRPGGERRICAVHGALEDSVMADVRELMGNARPYLDEDTIWAAFGWDEGGHVRQPTKNEMGPDTANYSHIVSVTAFRQDDQVAVSVSRVILDNPPPIAQDLDVTIGNKQWPERLAQHFPIGTAETLVVDTLQSQGFAIDRPARTAKAHWAKGICEHDVDVAWNAGDAGVITSIDGRYFPTCP